VATVLLCTGKDQPCPVPAATFVRLGFAVLEFDPSGRGKSWGAEDNGGTEHQDNVSCMLNWLHQQHPTGRHFVVSIGDGIVMATGGIINCPTPPACLISLNPCDVHRMTGRQYDDFYWQERDLQHFLPQLPCNYIHLTDEQADQQQSTKVWQLVLQRSDHWCQQFDSTSQVSWMYKLLLPSSTQRNQMLLIEQLWRLQSIA